MRIAKSLVVSTQHMPFSSPQFGEEKSIKYDYGYIVFLQPGIVATDIRIPGWFWPIRQKALEEKADYIVFDRDEPTDYDLPIYDWKEDASTDWLGLGRYSSR